MKRGVETSHLRNVGESPMKSFGQQNLLRQMLRIKRAELAQFFNHGRSDSLGLPILWPAMHDPMTDRRQSRSLDFILDPIHKNGHRRCVIFGHDFAGGALGLVGGFDREISLRLSYSFNFTFQNPPQRSGRFEQCEFDA